MPLPDPFIADQAVRRDLEALDDRLTKFENHKGGLWAQPMFGTVSSTTVAQYDLYLTRIVIPTPAVLTGVRYVIGGTAAGNALPSLFGPTGTQLATGSAVAQSGASGVDDLPFSATYEVGGGFYFVGLQFSDATATFRSQTALQGASLDTSPTDMTVPTTITPVTADRTAHPILTLY
ncbi:MAG: hypothetical protein ACYSUN_11225 [Planctomycetota bacterium]